MVAGARLDDARSRALFLSAWGRRCSNEDGSKVFRAVFKPERVVTVDDVATYSGSSEQAELWLDPSVDALSDYERIAVDGEKWWLVQPSPRVNPTTGFAVYTITPD